MRKKVAIVLPYFSNGGAQVMVSRLASHLDLSETEAEVICLYGKPQNNWMEKAVLDHGIPIRYIGKEKGFSGGAMIRLGRELDAFGPDVIHTHLSAGVYCGLWALTHRVKMLHTIHNIPDKELLKSKQLVMKALYKTGAAVPVAISHEIRSLTRRHYGLKKDPELVYNPVDTAKFAAGERPARSDTVMVTAGRLSPQKNHRMLIEAFVRYHREYEGDELFILGDGPCRQDLEKQIRDHEAKSYIHLKGNVEDVAGYFKRSDLFVLSSEYEGLPLVVLEAMAASLPVISTDVGGVKDLIDGNGILTEKGSEEGLLKAMLRLGQDREMMKEMGRRSFLLVQKYDSAVIAGEYEKLYRKYAR